MEFDFTDTQYQFRAAVRGFLTGQLGPLTLRKIWDESHEYDHRIWRGLAELGIAGLLVDERYGGLAGSPVDLTLVLEQCGTFAVPEPIVETALVAPLLLSAYGTESQRAEWLPAIASGEAIVAVAESAQEAIVSDGLDADAVIVLHDSGVHLVEKTRVIGRPLPGADPSRRLAECTLELDHSTLLSEDPLAADLVERSAATGTAMLLVGLSQHLMEVTRDYLLTRQQFGKRLGEFQVLKHRIADVAVQVEAARSLTWNAGYQLASADSSPSTAALAKGSATLAANLANAASLQLHGGIGFTWEHDLHLWLQRGKAWERAFGDTTQHRIQIGAERLGVA